MLLRKMLLTGKVDNTLSNKVRDFHILNSLVIDEIVSCALPLHIDKSQSTPTSSFCFVYILSCKSQTYWSLTIFSSFNPIMTSIASLGVDSGNIISNPIAFHDCEMSIRMRCPSLIGMVLTTFSLA